MMIQFLGLGDGNLTTPNLKDVQLAVDVILKTQKKQQNEYPKLDGCVAATAEILSL